MYLSVSYNCITGCMLSYCETLTLLTLMLQARVFRYVHLVWRAFISKVCITLFHHSVVAIRIWYRHDVEAPLRNLLASCCRSSSQSHCLNVKACTRNSMDVSRSSPNCIERHRWDAYSSDFVRYSSLELLHIVGVPPRSNDSLLKHQMCATDMSILHSDNQQHSECLEPTILIIPIDSPSPDLSLITPQPLVSAFWPTTQSILCSPSRWHLSMTWYLQRMIVAG